MRITAKLASKQETIIPDSRGIFYFNRCFAYTTRYMIRVYYRKPSLYEMNWSMIILI